MTLDQVSQSGWTEPTDPERSHPFRCVLGLARLLLRLPGLGGGAPRARGRGLRGGRGLRASTTEGHAGVGALITGFWALRIAGSECQALTKAGTREDLSVCPRKVGVRVNHECGEVVFYDATTSNHIYTFQASFPGQVFPFFWLLFPLSP